MKKQKLMMVSNALLFISFVIQAVAGVILFFYPGPRGLVELHRYNGLVFVILALAHIGHNWAWVKSNFLIR